MVQCPYCGVELEENANFCSLCGEPILDKSIENLAYIKSRNTHQKEKLLTDYQKLTGFQKRKIFWKISGMILISGIMTTLLIDFIISQNITWSKYPATVCFVLFINFSLNTFLQKKVIYALVGSFLSFIGLFFLLDVYAGETGWELKLGMPVLLAAYVTIFVLIFLIRNSKQKGLNIIAYSLIAAGVLCVCTDGIISIYCCNSLSFGWSMIVMASVLFISIFLLYIHYRLKNQPT